MITLPTLQQGDLIEAYVNGNPGWLRPSVVVDGTIVNAQFLPKGSRQQEDVTSPVVTDPAMFIRCGVASATIFEALVRTIGVPATVSLTK